MIIHADAVTWAKEYDGSKFHALLCDPPYHLTTITKRFGKNGSAPAQYGEDGAFQRASAGFMGKEWDGGDVAYRPETWAAFMRILHPGAFGMAFASARGWHRMAVAIEDAGFIIHPTMFGWAYGSGFPKATRVDTQIDKAAGVEQKIVGERVTGAIGRPTHDGTKPSATNPNHGVGQQVIPVKEPATALAKAWAGHRYGLQALKPALEPIIVFQKPYEGRPIDNITETGAGALNIDGGRIGTDEIPSNQFTDGAKPFGGGAGHEYETVKNEGRWPANFILLDQQAADALDKQSGELGASAGGRAGHTGAYRGGYKREFYGDKKPGFGDKGGASRFFYNVQRQLDEADPVLYQAKASRKERDAGLDGMDQKEVYRHGHGNKENDDVTARFRTVLRNPHPTVKPIDLTRYLATLLLPPVEYAPRRLFIPFAGVASEMIGAKLAGWEEVVGVEMTEEYIPIAEARLEHWTNAEIRAKRGKSNWENLPLFADND